MATFLSVDKVSAETADDIKSWVQLTHDAMLAVGCVQTSDSGQLLIDDIEEPVVGANYVLGYRVYEINDDLSSSAPIYIKIAFSLRRISNTSSTHLAPCGYQQIGFATDGEGAIVGPMIGNYYTYATSTGTSGVVSSYPSSKTMACKLNGYLALVVGAGCVDQGGASNVAAHAFVVRRTVNDEGEPTEEGCVIVFCGPSSSIAAPSSNNISYQYALRSGMVSDVFDRVFHAPDIPIVDGMIIASPALLNRHDKTVIDPYLVCVPTLAVSPGAIISLSIDDVEDSNYYVIGSSLSTSTASPKGVPWHPDRRAIGMFSMAVRFE